MLVDLGRQLASGRKARYAWLALQHVGLKLATGLAVLSALLLALPVPQAEAGPGRKLPAKFQKSPFHLMSLSVGHPNRGWQVRAKKLRRLPYLRIKKGSEKNVYGHPALVLMLRRTARQIARIAPGSKMLVGDLSTKGGGPLAGHRSHQSGRDADVGFYVKTKHGKKVTPKRFTAFGGDGVAKDGSGVVFDDGRNWLLVQAWLRDNRAGISHIFVSRPLRKRLLAYAAKKKRFRKFVKDAAVLLKQPERASAHDDHFHVRISCPKRQSEICHEQSAK